MADTAASPPRGKSYDKKRKKRKLQTSEDKAKAKATRRNSRGHDRTNHEDVAAVRGTQEAGEKERDSSFEVDERCQWRNLELLLSIKNTNIEAEKKVQLVYDYVNWRAMEDDSKKQVWEPVNILRVVEHINDWIQSLLTSEEKKSRDGRKEAQSKTLELCLDYRCWKILQFCLKESLKHQACLSLKHDLLRVILYVTKNSLSQLELLSSHSPESIFIREELKVYIILSDCVNLMFSSHGGMLGVNLDLWTAVIDSVLQLLIKVYADNLGGCAVGKFIIEISCLLLEAFSKFLRLHPCRQDRFPVFVDKLLDPLLHLCGVLCDPSNNSISTGTELCMLVKEVMSYGIFHPVFMDEFCTLHSTDKYKSLKEGELMDSKLTIKSYLRHLFDKLESMISCKKLLTLNGLRVLFELFINRVKKQRHPVKSESSRDMSLIDISRGFTKKYGSASEQKDMPSTFSLEMRKSIFDFFVLIMEPLLFSMNVHLQSELQVGLPLSDIHSAMQVTSKMLSSLFQENVYIRTEDSSEGGCLNFFKLIYGIIMSYCARISQLWWSKCVSLEAAQQTMLILASKDIILAVGYLLEIEYEVIGDELVCLWVTLLVFLAMKHSSTDIPELCMLTSVTVDLGCRLVDLYSELRQVNNAVFSLCSGARLLSLQESDTEIKYFEFLLSSSLIPHGAFIKSAQILLCSHKFRSAFCSAISFIPEGQASGCLQMLTTDISESLEWMKLSCSVKTENVVTEKIHQKVRLQAEALGKVLSEIYTLILDSLVVTTGNSNLLGVALKNLIKVLHPGMSVLVAPEQGRIDAFACAVLGMTLETDSNQSQGLHESIYLIYLFFFRLYVSCRSLYRQAVTLMPPDLSLKMSADMGDNFTACSGRDLMERNDFSNISYFYWIRNPSASLLTVIQVITQNFLQQGSGDCASLIYIMHVMALQRLVDLNRQMKAIEYQMQRNNNVLESKLTDHTELSHLRKSRRKWVRSLSVLKEEASGLTNFMMEYLLLVHGKQPSISTICEETANETLVHTREEFDSWDMSVSSLNERTLPTAIWSIICRNTDIWSIHAPKKKKKLFLSLLMHSVIPYRWCHNGEPGNHPASYNVDTMKVTRRHVSLDFLHDTTSYEQRFVRRYLASRLCRTLQKFSAPLFGDSKNIDGTLSSLLDWLEVLFTVEKSSKIAGYEPPADDCSNCDALSEECCEYQPFFYSISLQIAACQTLLNLLCHMPKEQLSFKTLTLYLTHLINFERLLVGNLTECHNSWCSHKQLELLRLLVLSRRCLKHLIMAYCEVKKGRILPIFSGSINPVLWLLKSVDAVIMGQHNFPNNKAGHVSDLIFSLIDDTSYVLLAVCKYQFAFAIEKFMDINNPGKQQLDSHLKHDGKRSSECNFCLNSLEHINALEHFIALDGALNIQLRIFLQSLNFTSSSSEVGFRPGLVDLNKMSSLIACLRGYFWGLTFSLSDVEKGNGNLVETSRRCRHGLFKNLDQWVDIFAEFMDSIAWVFLSKDRALSDAEVGGESSHDGSSVRVEPSAENAPHDEYVSESENPDNDSDTSKQRKRLSPETADYISQLLNEVDFFSHKFLKKNLLRSFVNGENLEVAFLLRELFIASSAILRLNMQINCSFLPLELMRIFVGSSEVLLMEFIHMVEVPKQIFFVCLGGALKYLEELGRLFPLTSPAATKNFYTRLLNLHLIAIGKCISFQGKRATLASHDMESSTKTFSSHEGAHGSQVYELYGLEELKVRLRASFEVLIRNSSELHLFSALQVLDRALVGVQEGCTTNYKVNTGSIDGGMVSSSVAAGVDCLDLVLEFVSVCRNILWDFGGQERLNMVKGHMQNILASLFNIILHLQGPAIFYHRPTSSDADFHPDSGSVVLMCVEVLARISGKRALVHMASCHVGQSLNIPSTLFKYFIHIGNDSFVVDRQFLIDFYAACCRLLCSILEHHKSACVSYMSILQNSVQALLQCLEMAGTVFTDIRSCFTLEVWEGIKCASYLRRIYEKIRQQKDVFGQHCFVFLSNYIRLYSGYGPLRKGIKREVDEALRPGVYALIDVCSSDDFQYLHTVFGEGPCRSTLARLRHDHKLNFRYDGKV